MSEAVRAFGERALVKRVEPITSTAGGVFLLPDGEDAKQPTHEAVVVSAGGGKRLTDGSRAGPLVKEGDRVLLHFMAGARSEIQHAGELLTFVHQDDILGVMA